MRMMGKFGVIKTSNRWSGFFEVKLISKKVKLRGGRK
jgi:hypothetical protein